VLPERGPRALAWVRCARALRSGAALGIGRSVRTRAPLRIRGALRMRAALGMRSPLRIPARSAVPARTTSRRRCPSARPRLRGRLAGGRPASPGWSIGLLAAANRRPSVRPVRAERSRGRHTGLIVRLRGSARGTSGRLHTKATIIAGVLGSGQRRSRVSRFGFVLQRPCRDGRFRPGRSVRGRSAVFRPRVPARGPALPS